MLTDRLRVLIKAQKNAAFKAVERHVQLKRKLECVLVRKDVREAFATWKSEGAEDNMKAQVVQMLIRRAQLNSLREALRVWRASTL